MKRECESLTLKFVFKNLPVIQEEFKLWQIPWVSKTRESVLCFQERNISSLQGKIPDGDQPTPEVSAFLPVLLNPQIKPLLQRAFYLSSMTLCMKENLYSASTHF